MSASTGQIRTCCAHLRQSLALCDCDFATVQHPCGRAVARALGEEPAGYVAVLPLARDRLGYMGSGTTPEAARAQAALQLAGATPAARRSLYGRLIVQPCTAAHLSDIAELLDAEVIQWL